MNSWFTCRSDGQKATVEILDEIAGPQTADDFARQLGDAQDVVVAISSGGGDTHRAMKVHDLLKPRNTTVRINRQCFSAALLIACAGRRIEIADDARMMWHKPIFFTAGTAAQLLDAAVWMETWEIYCFEIVAARMRVPAAAFKAFIGDRNVYWTADEARTLGLADAIVPPAPSFSWPAPAPLNPIGEPGPAEAGRHFIFDLLDAAGEIEVQDKQKLARDLQAWFCHKVKQSA